MTIIEADGVIAEPLTVDSLQIFAAQRYSFILHAKDEVGNFWIQAEQLPRADGGPLASQAESTLQSCGMLAPRTLPLLKPQL
jgi:FtsP/CotA-like multicopper oxidase with cupredoxin domain